jgi:hypothetical protein
VVRHALPDETQQPSASSRVPFETVSASLDVNSAITNNAGQRLMNPLGYPSPIPSSQRRYRAKSATSIKRERKKERLMAQIVHELDDRVQKGSPDSRSFYLRKVTEAKVSFPSTCPTVWHHLVTKLTDQPGFCRQSFFKRNKDEILAALSDMDHDVREGTKLHGSTYAERLAEARRYRHPGVKPNEGMEQRPNLNTLEASSSGSSLDESPRLPTARNSHKDASTSESPLSFAPDSRSISTVADLPVEGQYNDTRAVPDDILLLMPVETWVTPHNE